MPRISRKKTAKSVPAGKATRPRSASVNVKQITEMFRLDMHSYGNTTLNNMPEKLAQVTKQFMDSHYYRKQPKEKQKIVRQLATIFADKRGLKGTARIAYMNMIISNLKSSNAPHHRAGFDF